MVFGIWAANLWVFGELFLLAFLKMHSLLLQKHTWWKKKQFFSKNCIFVFFEICESFSSSCRQWYGRFAKISLCLFRRTFQRINIWKADNFFILTGIRAKVFTVLTRNIWMGGHNCILHVHRHFLRKVIFLSRNSYIFSWFSESELRICGFLENFFC